MSGLNPAQQQAVDTTEGPLLVLAGAGAGKTRVITERIVNIVRSGVAPEQILAITFTNKAASEMRERIMRALEKEISKPVIDSVWPERGYPARGVPCISTFHSLGLLIIKENAKLLGFKRMPAIYDRADSLRDIKAALKQFDGELEPRAVLSMISRAKGEGQTHADYAEHAHGFREELAAKIWPIYDAALRKEQALDFDDLLLRSMLLLRDNEAVRGHYQKRWTYIHVDEFQDTNYVQARMMELLTGPARNICAVGDVDQTIYGWRGAEIKNIMQFQRTFPGKNEPILLEENYRSTQNILEAANTVIAKNTYRPEKHLFTKNEEGEPISLYQAFDETDEANFIARIVREGTEKGKQPKDFAVLYRANFQSRAIEEALLRADIPYQVLGTRFFERKEVKDTLSFIRAALFETTADLGRVMDTLPGIGKVSKLKVLEGREEVLTGKIGERVREMRALLARIRETAAKRSPSELVQFVIRESGQERTYKEDKLEGTERLENLRELASLASRYDHIPAVSEQSLHAGLDAFLESAALASDQDELKDEANAVRLMTVHASKGLEFPAVFITGLEEGLFPYAREEESEADKEEERRLCYVAITRAQRKLYLCYASYRTVFGSKNATIPSQFLSDIPGECLELEMPERLGKTIYLE